MGSSRTLTTKNGSDITQKYEQYLPLNLGHNQIYNNRKFKISHFKLNEQYLTLKQYRIKKSKIRNVSLHLTNVRNVDILKKFLIDLISICVNSDETARSTGNGHYLCPNKLSQKLYNNISQFMFQCPVLNVADSTYGVTFA